MVKINLKIYLSLLLLPLLMKVRHRSLTGEVVHVRSPKASGVSRFVGLDIHVQLYQGPGKPFQLNISKGASDKRRYAKKFRYSVISIGYFYKLILTQAKFFLSMSSWFLSIVFHQISTNVGIKIPLSEPMGMWRTKRTSLTGIKLFKPSKYSRATMLSKSMLFDKKVWQTTSWIFHV